VSGEARQARKRELEREVEAGYELARAVNHLLARLDKEKITPSSTRKTPG